MNKEKFLKLFIIIQPILDLITSFQSIYMNFDISISLILRGLSFAFVIFYLLFCQQNKVVKKYTFIVITFFLVYITNIYCIKGLSFILSEMYTFIRFFYFPVMLIFFYMAYKELKKANLFDKKMVTYVTCFYFIIATIVFLANTSFPSYIDDGKIGFNGLFFSANERGNTYSLLLPLLFAYALKNKKYIGLILMGIFSMLILGTKVGYMGVVITLISALIYLILRNCILKDKNIIHIFIGLAMIVIIGSLTMYLPVYKNIQIQSGKVDEIINDKGQMNESELNEAIISDDNYLISDKNKNLIYSRREIFLEQNLEYYQQQNIISKMFGYGLENKKVDDLAIASKVERDFFDVFFAFGIIGFIIYFMPIIFIAIRVISYILKDFKKILSPSIWFSLTSIMIALAISLISGHVLVAPSVSIYLVLIICNLYSYLGKDLFIDKKDAIIESVM